MPGPTLRPPGRRRPAGPVAEQGVLFPPAVTLGDGEVGRPRLPQMGGQERIRRQILWFAILVLFWASALFARLVYLQVVRRGFFEEKARLQHQRTVAVPASRGMILDRRGRELAISVPVDSICAMPAEITDPRRVGAILARILGSPPDELIKKLSVGRGFCWIRRMADPEHVERIRALNLRGIYFQKESKRYYPKGATAAHLVGTVGLDQVGLAGIEQAREEDLQGRAGAMVVSTDARQREFAGRLSKQPEPGLNIVLTIDERVQYVAERELLQAVAQTGALAGSIVILEPATGAVLALANSPNFDPNEPVRSTADMDNRRNFAIASSFEPGSTFKLITISAALEEKLTRPQEVLDCQMGSIVVAGHRIRDHKPFGRLTVEQVLANSSDVGTIKLGMRLGERRLFQYIRRFGFGQLTGVELPGEALGLTKPAQRWSKISIGAISMGQEVGVTAIQLVQAVAAIANGGTLVKPYLTESTFENGGPRVSAPRAPARRLISQQTANQVKRMMEMVVEGGTGKLAKLEGYSAGGKTGTAQKIDPNTRAYSKTDYVASFVGFTPLHNPAIVVAVILDSPRGLHSGGGVAAPIFARVAAEVLRHLEVPPEMPIDPGVRRRRANPEPQLLAEVIDFNPENTWGPIAGIPAARVERAASGPLLASLPLAARRTAPAQGSVPNFLGKTVRVVVEQATAAGLELELRGSGLARRQSVSPGSPLPAGAQVTVEFER